MREDHGRPAGEEWVVSAADQATRLDKWLADAARLGSRARAVRALERGQVFVDGEEQALAAAGRALPAGTRVRWWRDRPGSASRRAPRRVEGLDILFEDGSLIVANKPAGLLTIPQPGPGSDTSLADLLQQPGTVREPWVVHRIDRDTSGVVAFARTREAWHTLKEQFVRREPERVYLAVVHGQPSPDAGTWRDWIRWDATALRQWPASRGARGAQEAITRYAVRETFAHAASLEIRLVSGRQHQVRVQAWMHGHPLIGERTYGVDTAYAAPEGPAPAFRRQALHAWRLGFRHPVDGRPLAFEAPVPQDLRRLLTTLRAER